MRSEEGAERSTVSTVSASWSLGPSEKDSTSSAEHHLGRDRLSHLLVYSCQRRFFLFFFVSSFSVFFAFLLAGFLLLPVLALSF